MWAYELDTVIIAYSLPTINVIIFICEIKMRFSDAGVRERSRYLTSLPQCACQKFQAKHLIFTFVSTVCL